MVQMFCRFNHNQSFLLGKAFSQGLSVETFVIWNHHDRFIVLCLQSLSIAICEQYWKKFWKQKDSKTEAVARVQLRAKWLSTTRSIYPLSMQLFCSPGKPWDFVMGKLGRFSLFHSDLILNDLKILSAGTAFSHLVLSSNSTSLNMLSQGQGHTIGSWSITVQKHKDFSTSSSIFQRKSASTTYFSQNNDEILGLVED